MIFCALFGFRHDTKGALKQRGLNGLGLGMQEVGVAHILALPACSRRTLKATCCQTYREAATLLLHCYIGDIK